MANKNLHKASAAKKDEFYTQLGILKETTGFKRNRMFVFAEYLALFEK